MKAFSISGKLEFPVEEGADLRSVPFLLTGSFDQFEGTGRKLQGAGSWEIDLSSVAPDGVKALVVRVAAPSLLGAPVPPVTVSVNGQGAGIEVSVDGFLVLASPTPAAGVSSLTITHTDDVFVYVWALV